MAFAHGLLNHTCGYFCQDGRHAVEAIAMPTISAEVVFAGYENYLRLHGWRAVSIRETTEADRQAWENKMGWYYDQELNRRVKGVAVFPKDARFWLVIIERIAHGQEAL